MSKATQALEVLQTGATGCIKVAVKLLQDDLMVKLSHIILRADDVCVSNIDVISWKTEDVTNIVELKTAAGKVLLIQDCLIPRDEVDRFKVVDVTGSDYIVRATMRRPMNKEDLRE